MALILYRSWHYLGDRCNLSVPHRFFRRQTLLYALIDFMRLSRNALIEVSLYHAFTQPCTSSPLNFGFRRATVWKALTTWRLPSTYRLSKPFYNRNKRWRCASVSWRLENRFQNPIYFFSVLTAVHVMQSYARFSTPLHRLPPRLLKILGS